MAAHQFGALLLTSLLAFATLASCNTEGDILYTQRQAWKDPNNVLESWDPTLVNPCTWFHVTCNNDNSVIRVDLGNAGLSGTLVPELGGLKNLQYLELYANNFSGPIPTTLGNLTSLVSLDLYSNVLSGEIPTSLGAVGTLRYLRLYENRLTGTIPASLGRLPKLANLELQENALTGSIPAALGNITTLQRLYGNVLTGTVPLEILSLVLVGDLAELNVRRNNLAGTVSSSTTQRVSKIIQDTRKTAN